MKREITSAQPGFLYLKRMDRSSPKSKAPKRRLEAIYECCLLSGSTSREGGPRYLIGLRLDLLDFTDEARERVPA